MILGGFLFPVTLHEGQPMSLMLGSRFWPVLRFVPLHPWPIQLPTLTHPSMALSTTAAAAARDLSAARSNEAFVVGSHSHRRSSRSSWSPS